MIFFFEERQNPITQVALFPGAPSSHQPYWPARHHTLYKLHINHLFFPSWCPRLKSWSTGDGPRGVLLQSELWEQEGKGDGRFVEIIVNRWTLWWSCGYYGGSVENTVDCCNWQYLAQFCLWRYFCWVGVKIIFSPCPHLHFWCHCSCSLLKMIVKTKSKWQVPMSDAMKNKARLALSGGRDIDRSVGKEFVNK